MFAKNIKRARGKRNRVAGIPWRNRYLIPYCLGATYIPPFHYSTILLVAAVGSRHVWGGTRVPTEVAETSGSGNCCLN